MACAKETGNTDEKLEKFCDPCQIEDEHTIAVSYCEECNEYLCKHCHKAHRRLAVSREHVVIEQNDLPEKSYPNLNKSELPEQCFAHGGQVIDHFCIFHEELCCSTCLSKSHQNCKDVRNIADYLKDADMEQEQRDLERKMRELADDVSNAMHSVQTSLKAIELNHEVAQSEMLKVKNAAIEHIEEIYGTLDKQLNETREEDVKKIVPYKNKCDAITFDLKAMESYIKSKKKCENYQSFVAKKRAGLKIKLNREDLKHIKFKNSLKVRRYHFIPGAEVTKLKTKPCFGTLNNQDNAIKSTSLVASLHARDNDDQSTCSITGLAVLKKDFIVLADYENKSVKLVDVAEDMVVSKVNFKSVPWDVTAISDKEIAVTVPAEKIVYFLSVTENSTLEKLQNKQIKHEGSCYGITKGDDKIFVAVDGYGMSSKLEQYGLDGKLIDSIKLDTNSQYITLSADRSNIYIMNDIGSLRSGCIEVILAADKVQRETLVPCGSIKSGMAIDKTNVLYYHAGYRQIYAICTDYQLSEGDKKGVRLISNLRCDPKCLAFCDETNRLFVGSKDEIEVYYVV